MALVRFRHQLPCLLRERLVKSVRLEGSLDGSGELPFDRELLVGKYASRSRRHARSAGIPSSHVPSSIPGEQAEDESPLKDPVKAVVPVDELTGGSLEFPDDVDDPGNGSSRDRFRRPRPFPEEVRASDRARESRRERSRARGPAQRSTATSPSATVTPSNAGSAPSAYERTATAIPRPPLPDIAKAFPETGSDRAGGGAPARGLPRRAPRVPWRPSRLRSPPALPRGPARSVHDTGSHLPRPRQDRPHLPSFPSKKLESSSFLKSSGS